MFKSRPNPITILPDAARGLAAMVAKMLAASANAGKLHRTHRIGRGERTMFSQSRRPTPSKYMPHIGAKQMRKAGAR
jgi:hypothetical protein